MSAILPAFTANATQTKKKDTRALRNCCNLWPLKRTYIYRQFVWEVSSVRRSAIAFPSRIDDGKNKLCTNCQHTATCNCERKHFRQDIKDTKYAGDNWEIRYFCVSTATAPAKYFKARRPQILSSWDSSERWAHSAKDSGLLTFKCG